MSITVTQSFVGDRVERLIEVHEAHIQWLLVLACLVHHYSEISDLIFFPCLVGMPAVHLQCPFRSSLGSFPV